jgi:hypothetical protein
MRRSGTTILYDALLADPGLACFYEPLREEKVSEGGGSGAREGDAFAAMRERRDEFRRRRFPDLAPEDFNWGGPRDPGLELEPALPEHCRELLAELLASAPSVAIKETRLYDKVADLHRLDPDAALVHVVREPRAVAASIVLGRGRRQLRKRYPDADSFFADRERRNLWSSYALSVRMAEMGEPLPEDASNVERVLSVWRHTFERTRSAGRELFGERYLMVRNEDLRSDPAGALQRVYAVAGAEPPQAVAAWAADAVRPPDPLHLEDDPRWVVACRRVGMTEELLAPAGYEEAVHDPPAASRLSVAIGRTRRRFRRSVDRRSGR